MRLCIKCGGILLGTWAFSIFFVRLPPLLPHPFVILQHPASFGEPPSPAPAPSPLISCRRWLEAADVMPWQRNFTAQPVVIVGLEQLPSIFLADPEAKKRCGVPCHLYRTEQLANQAGFHHIDGYNDGLFMTLKNHTRNGPRALPLFRVRRSLESAGYYPSLNLSEFGGKFDILSHTNLDSHVPAVYGSWRQFSMMAEPSAKKVGHRTFPNSKGRKNQQDWAYASAFISNCGGRSDRLRVLEELRAHGVSVDLYGGCGANAKESEWPSAPNERLSGRGATKHYIMKAYPFHLSFENTQEPGYVTEKYFGALSAGTVPVVLGAPDINIYLPHPDSILYLRNIDDVPKVAAEIKDLMSHVVDGESGMPSSGAVALNPYQKRLQWKRDGVSDGFKALIDTTVVHTSCGICQRIADAYRREEQRTWARKESLAVAQIVGPPPLEPPVVGGAKIAAAAPESEPARDPRPCRCLEPGIRGSAVMVHHLYVRERGAFEYFDVFIRETELTRAGLALAVEKELSARGYVPLWTQDRDSKGATVPRHAYGGVGTPAFEIWVYRAYPADPKTTLKDVLARNAAFESDAAFAAFVRSKLCAQIEVVLI